MHNNKYWNLIEENIAELSDNQLLQEFKKTGQELSASKKTTRYHTDTKKYLAMLQKQITERKLKYEI